MTLAIHEVSPEEVMALLDRELPVERAAAVSRHLEQCASCKEVQQPMRATSAALATWVVSEQRRNAEAERRLLEVARNAGARERGTDLRQVAPFFRRHWVLTAAASALAAGVLMIFSAPNLIRMQQGGVRGPSGYMGSEPWSRSRPVDLAPANSDRLGEHAEDSFAANGTIDKLEAEQAQLRDQGGDYRNWLAAGPMIARTVSLWIIAKDFGASRAALDAILLRHHGYAANLSVNAEPNAARSLQASLRVPAPELGAVLAELKALGRVQNETQNGEEVTQQHADLVARLKNSREEEIRLQDILRNRTGKIGDVLAVEQEIARVRGEIEQMEAEQKNLEHRVDFATVDVNLSEEYKAQLGTPAPSISTRFHNAVVKGIRGAQDTIVGILLFFAEAGPSLVLWAVLLLPAGWFFWRRWRRSYGLASSASL